MDNKAPSHASHGRRHSIRSFFVPKHQPHYSLPPGSPISPSDVSSPLSPTLRLPPTTISENTVSVNTQRSAPSLPEQVEIALIEAHYIPLLRRINSLLLPIHYPDAFYNKILSPDPPISFSRVILWTNTSSPNPTAASIPGPETKVIGSLISRLEPVLAPESTPEEPVFISNTYDIYIQSLTLLSPYRGKGIVAQCLQEIIDAAVDQKQYRIQSLYAHVWTENEEALQWYSKRQFEKEPEALEGYYRRLKPDTAWIMRRKLMINDHLGAPHHKPALPNPTWTFPSSVPAEPDSEPDTKPATPPPPPPAAIPPPPQASRPPPPGPARSFQHAGPEREWNDLPEDVLLKAPSGAASRVSSRERNADISRSSSRSTAVSDKPGKKKRVYPAAAFAA